MNTYTQLIDKKNIENCFILGAGPSLFSNMNNSLFCDLKKHGIIITVNSAILAEKEPHYWISCDHLSTRWSWWEDVKNSRCIKLVRNSWLKYKDDQKGFFYFKPRTTSEDIIKSEEKRLCYCCSVSSSIDFSLQMDCKKIFILGLDHNTVDVKHHFWQFFEKGKQPRQIRPAQGPWDQQKSVFPIHLQSYKALKRFAEYKNCKIYNCNPESKVEVFEKIMFKEIEKYL